MTLALNRRGLLAGGAALTFVIGSEGLMSVSRAAEPSELAPNPWLRIDAGGTVTIVFPGTEMGQGSSTALPLILAEELDADWSRVTVEQLDRDDRTFGNPRFGGVLYTAGSTGVPGYFESLRLAGAQARRVLIEAAAAHWDVPAAELTTEPGIVVHGASGRRLGYGEIVTLDTVPDAVPAVTTDDLKPQAEFRLIGGDVQRLDIPAKSSGRATYAIDVQIPDMVYATVLRAPVEGETPLEIVDGDTLAVPDVIRTLELPDGVAIVAERLEAALAGKAQLQVTWSDTSPARAVDSDAELEHYAAAAGDLGRTGAPWRADGDAITAIEGAARVVEADYRSDYAYHAQIEPMAAVAVVDEDGKGAEVWAGTQTQTWTTRTVVDVLETTPDRVRLHMLDMGGSFGRRTAMTQEYVRDALLVAKATGRPAKVIWSREDDLHHGTFRPAAAQRLRAGLAADGALQGWHHRVATPSVIQFLNPLRWDQVEPNDVISMLGSENRFYAMENRLAEHVLTERGARVAPWRGIGASYTSFAAEAFMDEVAEAAGEDPITFRLRLLAHDPRSRALLEQVVAMAEWDRPRDGTALGLAFAGYGDSRAAGIAEVALERDSGRLRVVNFWAAVDAGLVVAPDNALAQVEGGIVFGVSSALKERVTIKGGEVQQSNFYDYEILRMDETPEIEVAFAESTEAPAPIGEVGTPMVAPAIANAVHRLTGQRLRHLPFTPERVLATLA